MRIGIKEEKTKQRRGIPTKGLAGASCSVAHALAVWWTCPMTMLQTAARPRLQRTVDRHRTIKRGQTLHPTLHPNEQRHVLEAIGRGEGEPSRATSRI